MIKKPHHTDQNQPMQTQDKRTWSKPMIIVGFFFLLSEVTREAMMVPKPGRSMLTMRMANPKPSHLGVLNSVICPIFVEC